MAVSTTESIVDVLRQRGYKMTPQRRAILEEIAVTSGHITPVALVARVERRVPGVTPSTIYRTLELLENLGVLSHAHLESGAEYHRRSEPAHVHLTCSRCGATDSLSMKEAEQLGAMVRRHRGFAPDLTHFAISGLCASCQRDTADNASPGRSRRSAPRRAGA